MVLYFVPVHEVLAHVTLYTTLVLSDEGTEVNSWKN